MKHNLGGFSTNNDNTASAIATVLQEECNAKQAVTDLLEDFDVRFMCSEKKEIRDNLGYMFNYHVRPYPYDIWDPNKYTRTERNPQPGDLVLIGSDAQKRRPLRIVKVTRYEDSQYYYEEFKEIL